MFDNSVRKGQPGQGGVPHARPYDDMVTDAAATHLDRVGRRPPFFSYVVAIVKNTKKILVIMRLTYGGHSYVLGQRVLT